MTTTIFEQQGLLDEDGYPAWVTALASENHGIGLYVVRDLDPAAALERAGARRPRIRPVELPAEVPDDEWYSRAQAALGVAAGEGSALVSFAVGDWTVVYDAGGLTLMDQAMLADLAVGDLEAAHCSVNIELDTHVAYTVDGLAFWVGEPISVYRLEDLPERLRPAAEAAGIDWPTGNGGEDDEHEWDPAENFRLVCAIAGLRLTLDDVRALPLLGAELG
jgi:hypothetical protein